MFSTEVLLCDKDEMLWDEYFLLLMRRYPDLGLPYPFDMTFSFVGNPILSGNALIARTIDGAETVGALGFVFGTGADQFTDDSVCQIEALYVEPRWRHTMVPAALMVKLVEYIRQRPRPVERIQFWSPADRPELNRLFIKFSDPLKTNDKSFGRIRLFQTTPERLAAYAQRFAQRLQRRARRGETP